VSNRARSEVAPSEFWRLRQDKLADVLESHTLDADLCARLWLFCGREDDPPEIMDVLVITRWEEHPDLPEILVGERP
jgi:hypothetical protein